MKKSAVAIAVVVVGAAAFFAGRFTAPSQGGVSLQALQNLSQSDRQQLFQQFRGSGNGRNGGDSGAGGGFVSGEIISKDAQSVTIKLRDGSTKIVLFSSSTPITKPVMGTSDDLAQGKNATANGTLNSDGSITAQSIQVRENRTIQ